MGFTLAQEYLKNVGIQSLKPDLHILRLLGTKRLGLISKESPAEAHGDIMRLAERAKLNPAYVDNLLCSFMRSIMVKSVEQPCVVQPVAYVIIAIIPARRK